MAMAYEYKSDEEKDELEAQQGLQQPVQGQSQPLVVSGSDVGKDDGQETLSGPSGTLQPAAVGGPTAVQQPGMKQTPVSSGFKGIQSYLKENRPQAQQLARKVGSGLQKDFTQAQGAIDQSPQQFIQDVDKSTIGYDQDLASQAAADDFRGFDEDKTSAFRKMLNAKYEGPSRFDQSEGFTQAQQQLNQTQDRLSMLQDDSGRKALVSELQNSRRPSAGINSLNNLLLSRSPGAQEELQDLQTRLDPSSLEARLAAASQQAQSRADEGRATTDATRQQLRDQFVGDEGVVSQFLSGIDDRASQYQTRQQDIMDTLGTGGLDPAALSDQQLSDLGLSREQVQGLADRKAALLDANYSDRAKSLNQQDIAQAYFRKLSDPSLSSEQIQALEAQKDALLGAGTKGDSMSLDPLDYLTTLTPSQEITRDRVATADDYAREQALASLLGQDSTFSDPSLAGTVQGDTVDYDEEELKSALAYHEMINKYIDDWNL